MLASNVQLGYVLTRGGGQAVQGGLSCPAPRISERMDNLQILLHHLLQEYLVERDINFTEMLKECQGRLPTMYWLPKLHKRPYKARFIANSSSCTTTELSKLLTSCVTAVKNHVIRYCEKVYERSGKNLFWSIKNSGEVLNKLKSRGFRATSLSTYDFSTLYTTLPHNLIKEKLINLIEWTFKREGSLILPVTKDRLSSLLETQNDINFGLVKMCVKP